MKLNVTRCQRITLCETPKALMFPCIDRTKDKLVIYLYEQVKSKIYEIHWLLANHYWLYKSDKNLITSEFDNYLNTFECNVSKWLERTCPFYFCTSFIALLFLSHVICVHDLIAVQFFV